MTKIGDNVDVCVKTNYGIMHVNFIIVDKLQGSVNIYLGYAQGRIAIIQLTDKWRMLKDMDLIEFMYPSDQ